MADEGGREVDSFSMDQGFFARDARVLIAQSLYVASEQSRSNACLCAVFAIQNKPKSTRLPSTIVHAAA